MAFPVGLDIFAGCHISEMALGQLRAVKYNGANAKIILEPEIGKPARDAAKIHKGAGLVDRNERLMLLRKRAASNKALQRTAGNLGSR